MDLTFLSHINYLAVAVSSIVFFFLGSLWFSSLFGTMWREELQKHNVVINEPSKGCLFTKMALTFAANILASLCMASLVVIANSTTAYQGFILGLIAALGFAVTTLASVFIWESRSCKLFLIDVGYPVFGIILTGVILSLWR